MDMNTLQDALIRDLAALFKDFKLHSSINEESSLRIYRQFASARMKTRKPTFRPSHIFRSSWPTASLTTAMSGRRRMSF